MDTAPSRSSEPLKTCDTDRRDKQNTHLYFINTLHPDIIWPTQQNPS